MEYQLTAEVDPPSGTPALDALQRHGVAALLDEHLELLAEIEGPDGVEIEPLDHRIAVHPGGASVTWVLDAPALAFAEDAAGQVLGELLERTGLLADWTVRRCEVTASDEELAAALAGGSDEADVEIEIDLDDLGTIAELAGLDDEDSEDARRGRLLVAAEGLGAFGLDAFGLDDESDEGTGTDTVTDTVTEEAALLAAGALMTALEVVTEELFTDVQTLEEAGTPAAEHEVLWVLHDLPTRYAAHYSALFAKKLLVTTAILGYRLGEPEWDGPRCVAEALVLRLLTSTARNQLDLAGLLDEAALARTFEVFEEYAFAGLDVDSLYADDEEPDEDEDPDEIVLLDWFELLEPVDSDEADDEAEIEEDQTVQA